MTRFWLFILICGLIFTGLTTAFSPRLISWYATPPIDIGVSCDGAIHWGLSKLISLQLIGLGAGSLFGATLFFWIRGKRRPVSTPVAPASTLRQ